MGSPRPRQAGHSGWPIGPRTHLPVVFLGLSLAAHASVVLILKSSPLARERVSTVARFVGTTFEIEALFTDAPPKSTSSPPEPALPPPEPAAVATEPDVLPESTQPPATTRPVERQLREGREEPPERPSEQSSPSPTEDSLFDQVLAFQPGARPSLASRPATESARNRNSVAVDEAGASPAQPKYGAEGLPSGVVELRAAFIKTLPLAAKSDPTWLELPLGDAGQVDVVLRISPDHALEEIQINVPPGREVPEYLQRMIRINRSYLLRGRFAVDTTGKTGVQRLRILAQIVQGEPDRDTPDAPGVNRLGQLGGSSPSGAYFAYFSGRRVEFEVQALAP